MKTVLLCEPVTLITQFKPSTYSEYPYYDRVFLKLLSTHGLTFPEFVVDSLYSQHGYKRLDENIEVYGRPIRPNGNTSSRDLSPNLNTLPSPSHYVWKEKGINDNLIDG